jgi:glucose/arabinose dehydrogenase
MMNRTNLRFRVLATDSGEQEDEEEDASFGRKAVAIGLAFGLAALTTAAGCRGEAKLPVAAGMGPNPVLPHPTKTLMPTVNIAPARGWPADDKPTSAEGTSTMAYATGLQHPRWLYVLPNGDVLVAETNAPPKPEDTKGVRGWFMKRTMKKAGSAGPSANRITLLRDANGDGVAETQVTFLEGLHSPFGMALVGEQLFVAETDALVRYPYRVGDTRITAAGAKVIDLPAGPLNHHWTKNVVASADGTKLYVSIGSNSNAAENGIQKEEGRAAIWEVDAKSGAKRTFASGLRNPVGMAFNPISGQLWVTVNERDELGSDLVPDYMTQVRDGGF